MPTHKTSLVTRRSSPVNEHRVSSIEVLSPASIISHSVISQARAYKTKAVTSIKTIIEPNSNTDSFIKGLALIVGSFVAL